MTTSKPGDVAMIPFGWGDVIGLYTVNGWVTPFGPRYPNKDYTDIRPVVVIDPESAEDVRRLADLFCHARWSHIEGSDECDPLTRSSMLAALREFAAPTPPKPAEPQGLGAVVEDGGVRYTRWSPSDIAPWIAAFPVDANRPYRYWSGFSNAVRVLSEGVTP